MTSIVVAFSALLGNSVAPEHGEAQSHTWSAITFGNIGYWLLGRLDNSCEDLYSGISKLPSPENMRQQKIVLAIRKRTVSVECWSLKRLHYPKNILKMYFIWCVDISVAELSMYHRRQPSTQQMCKKRCQVTHYVLIGVANMCRWENLWANSRQVRMELKPATL